MLESVDGTCLISHERHSCPISFLYQSLAVIDVKLIKRKTRYEIVVMALMTVDFRLK